MSVCRSNTRPAGISYPHHEDAVWEALEDSDRPPTPLHVHRFRDMRIEHEPGMPVRHPGTAVDPLPPPSTVYGRRTPKDAETAADVLHGAPQSRLEAWRQQQAESIYSSTQQRPLGRCPLPRSGGASLASSGSGASAAANVNTSYAANAAACESDVQPPQLLRQQRWGRQLADGRGAREALTPNIWEGSDAGTVKGPGVIHRQYVTSHHDYWPGEQLSRHYEWGGLDPKTYAFGASPAATPRDGSAARALLSGAADSADLGSVRPDASSQPGRRRSASFSNGSGGGGGGETHPAASGGPSYGWSEGGCGYTTGAAAAAAAAASDSRKQLHDQSLGGHRGHMTHAARIVPKDHVFGVPSHGREPQEAAGALIHSQAPTLPVLSPGEGHGQVTASTAPADRQAAGVPSRPPHRQWPTGDAGGDRGGATDICGRPLARGSDPAIGEVLFPSAPRNALSGPEAEVLRSRAELWDLLGVPLKLTRAEFDAIVSVAAAGDSDRSANGPVSVADCMRVRQSLRPAASAYIIS